MPVHVTIGDAEFTTALFLADMRRSADSGRSHAADGLPCNAVPWDGGSLSEVPAFVRFGKCTRRTVGWTPLPPGHLPGRTFWSCISVGVG